MSKKSIKVGGKLLDMHSGIVAGIINLTPDSFYKESRNNDIDSLLETCSKMIDDGAKIIDFGAFSTRPGAEMVNSVDEISRLREPLQKVRTSFPVTILSIDSFRSEVINALYDSIGEFIVNDISGGKFDDKLYDTVADLQLPYILMHLEGSMGTMHDRFEYKDIVNHISVFFAQKKKELYDKGIADIILDPGFGFSKSVEQNYELLSRLDEFSVFEEPLLVGLSRKSMIYKPLDISPEEALNGSTVLQTVAAEKGASIFRTHDVKEATETLKLLELISMKS